MHENEIRQLNQKVNSAVIQLGIFDICLAGTAPHYCYCNIKSYNVKLAALAAIIFGSGRNFAVRRIFG